MTKRFARSRLSRPVRRGVCFGVFQRIPRAGFVSYHGHFFVRFSRWPATSRARLEAKVGHPIAFADGA